MDGRHRDGGDEEADGEDAPPLVAAPGACCCWALDRYWRDDGDAAVMIAKMVRLTARTSRPSRPLSGRVNVEPPTATEETARRRGGEGEKWSRPDCETSSSVVA